VRQTASVHTSNVNYSYCLSKIKEKSKTNRAEIIRKWTIPCSETARARNSHSNFPTYRCKLSMTKVVPQRVEISWWICVSENLSSELLPRSWRAHESRTFGIDYMAKDIIHQDIFPPWIILLNGKIGNIFLVIITRWACESNIICHWPLEVVSRRQFCWRAFCFFSISSTILNV